MLTLFAAKGTCSLASAIALEEAHADYTLHMLDFSKNEQRGPEYLKLNPKARVPALSVDGAVITENVAILAFVAQHFPKANLAPADAVGFAQMQAVNAYLSSTVHVAHAHYRRGYRWSDDPAVIEALKIKVPQNMTDCFHLIEHDFLQGPYVMGEQLTVADAYLFTLSGWLAGDGVAIANFPKAEAHHKRMGERAAVNRALAKHG